MTETEGQNGGKLKAAFTQVKSLAAAAALTALTAACSGAPETSGTAPNDAPGAYQLGAGDVVQIKVFGDDSLSGEQKIDGQGKLAMPLAGNVDAKGLTTDELQERLEAQLGEYRRDAEVTVSVMEYRPFYILGEVKEPGGYPYVEGMSVVNAIAMAGGYTYRARKNDFVLQREAGQQAMRAEDGTPLLPGDVITVRERYF